MITPTGPFAPLRSLFTLLLALGLAFALLSPVPAWGAEPGAEPARGDSLFLAHCAGCHVNGGNIIRRGRTLKLAALERNGVADPEAIARIAAAGIGQMGGYASQLGEGGPEAVGAWVWQQAQAGWPRP